MRSCSLAHPTSTAESGLSPCQGQLGAVFTPEDDSHGTADHPWSTLGISQCLCISHSRVPRESFLSVTAELSR